MNASRERMWRLALPLACYLGVTLVAPALRGAMNQPGFAMHAVITLSVTAAVASIVGLSWVRFGAGARGRRQPVSPRPRGACGPGRSGVLGR